MMDFKTIFGVFSSITAVLVGAAASYVHYRHRKYAHIPGPPRSSFWLGNISAIKESRLRGQFFQEYLLECIEKYGDTFVLFFLHEPLVVTINPDGVKELLVTGGHLKSERSYERTWSLFGARFLGNGLVTDVNHERWSNRRAKLNPAFHRSFLREIMGDFNETANFMMTKLLDKADGKTVVSLMEYIHRTTLDVIGKVAFGMDINSVEDEQCPFPQAISKALAGFAKLVQSPLTRSIPFIDSEFRQEVREACLLLRKTGRELLEKRRHDILNGEVVPDDILTSVIKTKGLENELIGEELEETLDDFVTFFIAGQETTANTVSFIVMELSRHPEILNRIYEEVNSVIGEKDTINFEDLNNLEYTHLVIKEGLRLGAPVGLTFRHVTKAVEFSNLKIPADTHILIHNYSASRYSKFHPDTLSFRPERFSKDSAIRPEMYTYFPFSMGPRNCIGQNFAMIETKILLAKLIQRFEWESVPGESFKMMESTTIKPKDGVKVTLKPRV